jgi:protein SCO1/2
MRTKLILVAAIFLAGCGSAHKDALPFYNTPDFTPVWAGDGDKTATHTVAPFSLTAQDGSVVTRETVAGKVYIANFFFTRCGSICPRMTGNLQRVAAAFAGNGDVKILSHSVTPDIDSVPVLARYARLHGIDARQWLLLTGSQEAIYALARRSYFADEETGYERGPGEFLHTENCVLVDGKGRIRGVYNGTVALEMEKLVGDVKTLLRQ